MVPSGATTRPMIPVSSSISRTAACSAVSPTSMWPFGSDHSNRPRRSSRPINAAVRRAWSTTSPPAEVSSTVRSRRRRSTGRPARRPLERPREVDMPAMVTMRPPPGPPHAARVTRPWTTYPVARGPGGALDWLAVRFPAAPDSAVPPELVRAQENAVVDLVPIPPVADELAGRFTVAGYRIYLVGGSVRDALLGRPQEDLDFTTDARPPAV